MQEAQSTPGYNIAFVFKKGGNSGLRENGSERSATKLPTALSESDSFNLDHSPAALLVSYSE